MTSKKHKDFSAVIKLYGLNEKDLLTEVSEFHIQEIPKSHCSGWKNLPVHLEMENPRQICSDIENDVRGAKSQRERFFDVWKSEKKTDATYYILINALLNNKKREDAEFVCSLLKEAAADVSQGTNTQSKLGKRIAKDTESDDDEDDSDSKSNDPQESGHSKREPKAKKAKLTGQNEGALAGKTNIEFTVESDSTPLESIGAEESVKRNIFEMSCFDWTGSYEDQPHKPDSRQQALVIPSGSLLWKPGSTLKVSFKDDVPYVKYGRNPITTDKIISWMNEWSMGTNSIGPRSCIPIFKEVETFEDGDIRIEFSDVSNSYIGRAAEQRPRNESTMKLNLHVLGHKKDPEKYKKCTVLHETGHALGFGHEHQHPHLSTDVFKEDTVIDDLMTLMKFDDRDKASEFYDINYKRPARYEKDAITFPFDKDSVMRYWVKKSWVTSRHQKYFYNHDKNDDDTILWPASALKGEVTSEDRENATKAYGGSASIPPGQQTPGAASGQQVQVTPSANKITIDVIMNGIKNSENEVVYCLSNFISGDWRKVGSILGIDYVTLNQIRDDKSRFLTNEQRLEEVLIIWEKNERKYKYKLTKNDLCTLLRDCDHGTAAENIEKLLTM